MSDRPTIQFSDQKSQVNLEKLQNLFNLGAFWAKNRQAQDLAKAIHHSNPVISVWHGEQLIGFGRATSDGVYRATIWDVVIHPHYQGMGLGTKLVETLLSHPELINVERVYLMTTHQQNFYQKIGFQLNHSTTMIMDNSNSQFIPEEVNILNKSTLSPLS